MKYIIISSPAVCGVSLWLILLIFILVGCGEVVTPLDIIEHNVDVMDKAKQDINDIENTVNDKNEEIEDLLNDAGLSNKNVDVLGVEEIIIPEKFDLEDLCILDCCTLLVFCQRHTQ